jgi:ubiquinone/menaquinone biosynthesis C-methylase UbiE
MTETPTYGRHDQFRNPEGIDAATARNIAQRLDSHSADQASAARTVVLDTLDVGPGAQVLEVGCGTGAVLRMIAARVAPGGRAVGVDPSPQLLTIARERLDAEGLASYVETREGDARSLPVADGEFDTVLAVNVLLHVPQGETAIPELIRAARPGGMVGIYDRDNDSFIVSHPNRALTRRVIAAGSDHTAMNSWIVRAAPRLLHEGGLIDVQARGFVLVERTADGAFGPMLQRWAEAAAAMGNITAAERDAWLAGFAAEAAGGDLVVGVTHLLVWGTKPV